ncbi:uncharacterized protein CYBJADRAFT_166029, partial [Cyberlindnera jadinii NRRL Y-1542]
MRLIALSSALLVLSCGARAQVNTTDITSSTASNTDATSNAPTGTDTTVPVAWANANFANTGALFGVAAGAIALL